MIKLICIKTCMEDVYFTSFANKAIVNNFYYTDSFNIILNIIEIYDDNSRRIGYFNKNNFLPIYENRIKKINQILEND